MKHLVQKKAMKITKMINKTTMINKTMMNNKIKKKTGSIVKSPILLPRSIKKINHLRNKSLNMWKSNLQIIQQVIIGRLIIICMIWMNYQGTLNSEDTILLNTKQQFKLVAYDWYTLCMLCINAFIQNIYEFLNLNNFFLN